jgi:DNA-binding CsgD family transcriptional regulator
MAVFTARELAVIDKIKKVAKTASSRDKLKQETLGLLKAVIPFNSAVFFDVNPATLEFTGAFLDNLDRDFLLLYFQKFYKRGDAAICLREFLKNEYVSDRSCELVGLKPYTASQFYKELLSRYHCHYFLATSFSVNQECLGYLILWRTQTERNFLEKHPEIMRTIAPTISQGLKNRKPDNPPAPADQPISEERRLLEIVNRRSPPGVLILDRHKNILYKNEEAQTILYLLSKSWMHPEQSENGHPGMLPTEILKLSDKLWETSSVHSTDETEQIPCVTSTVSFGSEIYSLRALLLDTSTEFKNRSPIIVLIENISPAQRLDLEKARDRYHLTFKEKEVVELLFQGFTNKEVAKELCIGAYTLKDHLRNIRQKMGVFTRTGILSKIIQL